jgi:hypothetical protein
MPTNSQYFEERRRRSDRDWIPLLNEEPESAQQVPQQRFDLLDALLPDWPSQLNAWA